MLGLRLPLAVCSPNVLSCPAAGKTTARCPAPPSRRAFPMKPPAPGISQPSGPDGFVCPACGHDRGWGLKRRRASWECAACGKETSVTAGTIMHRSHLPLKTWFMAVHIVTSHSNGISALQLQAQLGLGSYKSAWLLLHKLRRAMVDPDRSLLEDLIEIDGGHPPVPHRKRPCHRRARSQPTRQDAHCRRGRAIARGRAHAASGWRRSGISPRAAFVPSLPGPRRRARG